MKKKLIATLMAGMLAITGVTPVMASDTGASHVLGTGSSAYNVTQLWANLEKSGFSNEAAAAVIGCVMQKSEANPSAISRTGEAVGLMQWSGARKERLLAYDNWDTLSAQLHYLLWECEYADLWISCSDYPEITFDQFKSWSNVEEAVTLFTECYDRPCAEEYGDTSRYSNAQLIYSTFCGSNLVEVEYFEDWLDGPTILL